MRQQFAKSKTGSQRISIHAPMKGATIQRQWIYLLKDISIHAPMKGATLTIYTVDNDSIDFNPRTHEGCDPFLIDS